MKLLVLAVLACFKLAALAQDNVEESTLAKIDRLGAVYLGHRESAPPFSYLVDGKATGYTVEICLRVVDGIRKRLGKPDLKVVEVAQPANLRFAMLIDGIVDMECGASTNTKLRQQRMAFSTSIFEAAVKFLVPKEAAINRIADLDGKTVVTLANTTAHRTVATAAARRNINIRLTTAQDRPQAFELIKTGKVQAFVGDDALLTGFLLTSSLDSGRFRLMEEALSSEPYGIAIRRDDPEMKKLVDQILTDLMKSGEIDNVYRRWFESPIPPSGKSMGIPMTPRLKELFTNPSDAGV